MDSLFIFGIIVIFYVFYCIFDLIYILTNRRLLKHILTNHSLNFILGNSTNDINIRAGLISSKLRWPFCKNPINPIWSFGKSFFGYPLVFRLRIYPFCNYFLVATEYLILIFDFEGKSLDKFKKLLIQYSCNKKNRIWPMWTATHLLNDLNESYQKYLYYVTGLRVFEEKIPKITYKQGISDLTPTQTFHYLGNLKHNMSIEKYEREVLVPIINNNNLFNIWRGGGLFANIKVDFNLLIDIYMYLNRHDPDRKITTFTKKAFLTPAKTKKDRKNRGKNRKRQLQ